MRSLLRRDDPLWRAVRLLGVDGRRALVAVLSGATGLASAVALAAVSAWLIARASQMPPVMSLGVAAVAVRTFGLSRGVLRYVERLVSHDVALRGMATLRVELYERLSRGSAATLSSLRRGDLLARVGADVDSVGDVVVRGLLPIAVAGVLGCATVALVATLLPTAAAALAACLLLSGLMAPWWAVRAARTAEQRSARAREQMTDVSMTLLDGGADLLVAGRVPGLLLDLQAREKELATAADAAARPASLAAATTPLAVGAAVVAALVLGIPATTAGALSPVELAVVVLTPLAAFEATALLPAAAVQLMRSRRAARRVVELLDAAEVETRSGAASRATPRSPAATSRPPAVLEARALACGWPGGPPLVTGLDLRLEPGRSLALVGPSGAGKTTVLLTLAGLLPPLAGTVTGAGREMAELPRTEAAALVALTTEDAHVFDTTVLENLRVARGDVDEDAARAALRSVGLEPWLRRLPDGLATTLGSDAARLSGGERRRLLVARALLTPAPLLLLDEPTEHVDAHAPALLRGLLDHTLTPGRGVLVVTHRLDGLEAADEVILLDRAGLVPADPPVRRPLTTPPVASAYRGTEQSTDQETR